MALFGKKSLDGFTLEELQAEIAKRQQVEETEQTEEQEPVEQTEAVDENETVEEPAEQAEAVEEPVEEDGQDGAEKIDANTEVIQAIEAKLSAALEEIRDYKEKVDTLLARVAKIDEPAETVGLEKAKTINDEKSDEDLNAHEYARKHAKY